MKRTPTLLDALAERGGSRPRPWGWLAAGIWLFYLANPLQEMAKHSHGVARVVGIAALFLFAISYLAFFVWIRQVGLRPGGMPLWKRLAYLACMLVLAGLMVPAAGQTALTTLVYVTAIGMMALELPVAVALTAVLLGGAESSVCGARSSAVSSSPPRARTWPSWLCRKSATGSRGICTTSSGIP